MNIETVLIMYRNVINYEVSRVLHENIDLWDEAIQESFIRINASLDSILEKEGKYQENYIRVVARNAARTILSNRRNFHAKHELSARGVYYLEVTSVKCYKNGILVDDIGPIQSLNAVF